MDIETLKGILARPQQSCRPTKLVIVIKRPGSIGGTPCVEVESVHAGFDWDNGKLMIYPAQPLTALTPEQLEEIHESVRLGQSWHANQAHMKTAAQRRAAEAELASYKVDAERYRFGREVMVNTDLQNSLAPLLDEWGAKTPEATTAEEHDAQADHMIAVARAAGLWPIKTEGEAA